jgi:hypothetical protein
MEAFGILVFWFRCPLPATRGQDEGQGQGERDSGDTFDSEHKKQHNPTARNSRKPRYSQEFDFMIL